MFADGDNLCEGRHIPQSAQRPNVSCSAGSCSTASISNVGQLKAVMRTVQPGSPACVRLLNATGTVGCGTGITIGPIAALENPKTSLPSGAAACLCWCLPATSGMIVWAFSTEPEGGQAPDQPRSMEELRGFSFSGTLCTSR